MIMSWIISGVPRMIQTMIFVSQLKGLNRDMEPKAITSPRGTAPTSVTKNSFSVCRKPAFRERMTIGSCSIISSILLLCRFLSCSLRVQKRCLHTVFFCRRLHGSILIALCEEVVQNRCQIRALTEAHTVFLAVQAYRISKIIVA